MRAMARPPRANQQALGLLGEPHDHALPVFVHGPHVTGKSSIVRDVFTTLGRPFAYTSLVDSHTPRLLLDAILEELQPHLEGLTEKHTRCDRLADLVSLLAKGLPADGPAVYLVIDEATRLLDWKGTDHLLPALMKLSELTGAPHDRLRHARSNPIPLDDAGRLPSPSLPRARLIRQLSDATHAQVETSARSSWRGPDGTRSDPPRGFVRPSPCYSTRTPKRSCRPSSSPSAPRMRTRISTTTSSRPSSRCTRRRVRVCTSFARCSDRCGGGTRRRGRRPGTTGTRRRRREARRFQSPNRRRKATPNGTRTPGRVSPNRDISSRCSSSGTPRRRSLEEARRGLPARDRREATEGGPGASRGSRGASLRGVSALARGDWPVPEDAGVGAGKLDFDIPRLTKFMLLSAHLATNNKESVRQASVRAHGGRAQGGHGRRGTVE